jgi:G3E family GTPase
MERLSTIIVTGFLGSGKTTLLNRLLQEEGFRDTAVLVNEFGEVGLDHDLIRHSTERMVVMAGGCICCSMREDVETALRELFDRRDRGEIPKFNRIVIETTGLADPIPLLLTLRTFGLARARLHRPQVVTTVDAVLNEQTICRFKESIRQIAAADVVLITKTDRAGPGAIAEARARIVAINPLCGILLAESPQEQGRSALLEAIGLMQAGSDSATDVCRQHDAAGLVGSGDVAAHAAAGAHGARSFAITLDRPVDWGAFGVWLTLLLHRYGDRVLRVKGIVNVASLRAPVVFHAAQHMVHPPEHLECWPSDDHRSRIVFIVLGLEPEAIFRSIKAFNALADHIERRQYAPAVKSAGAGGTVAGRPVRRPTAPSWIRG